MVRARSTLKWHHKPLKELIETSVFSVNYFYAAYCLTEDCYRKIDCRHHLKVSAVGPVVAVKTQQGFQASVQIIKKILP